jgi:membrane protein implicated in regulation of membrane protease activity
MAATQSSAVERRRIRPEAARAEHRTPVGLVAIVAVGFVIIWVGLIALAVSMSGVGYAAPLAMGAAVGVLAGVFWGAWYAFVAFSHQEDKEFELARTSRRRTEENNADAY